MRLSYKNLFYTIWAFYSAFSILTSSTELAYMYNFNTIIKYTYTAIVLMLGFLYIYPLKLTKKLFVLHVLFVCLITLIEISITEKNLIIISLFIMCFRNIKFREMIKFDFVIKLYILLFVLLLYWLGEIDGYEVVINGIYKQSFGFGHPNTFSIYVYTMLLELIYLRFNKMNFLDIGVFIGVGVLILKIGGGRSSGYTYFAILVVTMICKFFPKIYQTKISALIFTVITPIAAVMSFVLAKLYVLNNEFAVALNTLTTGRLRLSAIFLNKYSLKLFGQEIETLGTRRAILNHTNSMILDCAYIKCGLKYGLIFLIILCISYSLFLRKSIKDGNITDALFALFFVVIGIAESYLLAPVFNLSLLLLLEPFKKIFEGKKIV